LEADERPVLAAVARAATELTGARGAVVVAVRDRGALVLATAGPEPGRAVGEQLDPTRIVGDRLEAGNDTLSFVLASGQALSIVLADGDDQGDLATRGHAASGAASLCVPCVAAEGVVGALELIGGSGSGSFDVAATRVAELLAEIATAALAEDGGTPATAPAPDELAAELTALAAIDQTRYRAVARALESLLAGA
jgi:GAF domain-containing protein